LAKIDKNRQITIHNHEVESSSLSLATNKSTTSYPACISMQAGLFRYRLCPLRPREPIRLCRRYADSSGFQLPEPAERSGEVTRSFVDAGLQRIDQHKVIALEILIQIAGNARHR